MQALKDNSALIDPMTGQPVLVDQNGAITTDPNLGKPLLKSQIAMATQHIAKQAADAMQDEIEDQLIECEYNAELRKVIHNSAVTGTGVIKGPIVVKRVRKAWREKQSPKPDGSGVDTAQVLEVVEELRPASYSVDPRMVWEDPDCGDNVQHGQGIFELEKMTAKRVRELAKQPGYLLDQLTTIIGEDPQPSAELFEQTQQEIESSKDTQNKLFYRWTYWGELDSDDLKAAGVEVPSDALSTVSGCVEMINDRVIRAYLNPLDSGEIPYDFLPWEKVSGSVRGYGVVYLMKAQQSVTNASWRMMMDNAGVTSRGQVLVKKSQITPVDGTWQLTPGKFWNVSEEVGDPRSALSVVEFENHQQELSQILELAEKLADQETSTPTMAHGQQGSAPETVGGMQLLMNGANVVLRRLVKQFDDCITRPHIRRYYDYNMAYSEDEEIKGDFVIDARGSSALVVRDVQNQAFMNLMQQAGNPVIGKMIDPQKLFEHVLRAQHIDPTDILLPEQKILQNENAPPPPDPRVQAAQIAAQARVQEAQAIAQGRTAEVQARVQGEEQDRALRVQELEAQQNIEIIKTSAMTRQTIQQVKAQLAVATINDRSKRALGAAKPMPTPNQPGAPVEAQ